jgi:flagellar basal body-associated protein FliL
MARKAKLDILEIHAEDHLVDIAPSQQLEPDPAGQQPHPLKRQLHKKLIITCVIVISFCFIAVGLVFFWMRAGGNNNVSLRNKRLPAAMTDMTQRNVANLDNFVIDYREQGGAVRIVLFALAVELNGPAKKDAIENQVELRGDIYALSKKKTIASLLTLEERGTLRNEIAAELEKRLGAGAVKAVYFTKFYII